MGEIKTGYFANTKSFTKVHLVDANNKPICGSVIKNKTFQVSAYYIVPEYIECEKCKVKIKD